MHIAIAKRKCGFSRLGEGLQRVPKEDLLTSMFFGTLRYLPEPEIATYLGTTLRVHGAPRGACELLRLLKLEAQPRIGFRFWPNLAGAGRVEPDVLIEVRQKNAPNSHYPLMSVLIECKWDSLQSGQNQLKRQWYTLPEAQRRSTIHVYLVKNLTEGHEDVAACAASEEWLSRIVVLSWAQLVRPTVHQGSTLLHRWLADMTELLAEMGVAPFGGFRELPRTPHDASPLLLFWHGAHGFRGFQWLRDTALDQAVEPLFYRTRLGFQRLLPPGPIRYFQPVFWRQKRRGSGG